MQSTFIKLDREAKKGENGTILVIGGSALYTGAPLFSAMGAMRSGADLVYIFCEPEALSSIKTYHEAIALPAAYSKRILRKITACVVGPGLGRIDKERLALVVRIVKYLNARDVPIILDADAIHYYKRGCFHFVKACVITPNYKEKIGLAVREGHVCIYKGVNDVIAVNGGQHLVFAAGSKKRCGGQGDVLTGVLATALSLEHDEQGLVGACVSACELVRGAAQLAFKEKSYGVVTGDIIEKLPSIIKRMLP